MGVPPLTVAVPILLLFSVILRRPPVVASAGPLHCYSCSTIDAVRLMGVVHDPNWRNWLEQVRTVPRTTKCADSFGVISALRHGVRSQSCAGGICLKLWFSDHQNDGDGHVWRWCAKNVESRLREDCTHIKSSKGEMEVCTCEGNLCNDSTALAAQNAPIILSFFGLFSFAFIFNL